MARSPTNQYSDVLRNDLAAFIHRSFLELYRDTMFHGNWHLEVIAKKLEEVRNGTCRRLIINVPPRQLKSFATSIAFPAWILGHNPNKQILTISYGQDLSDEFARHTRALMMSPFYEALFSTRLSKERDAVSDYRTVDGGFRRSTSTGGILTGFGADLIIIDDALKADDALSDKRRGDLNAWYDNTVRSRLNNPETGAIIIVMQRLHVDDLVAHVQKHEKWDVLSFPATAENDEIFEIDTPYGRQIIKRAKGDVLHPALLSLTTLQTQRRAMTEYNFSAQYQQNPQPLAGNIVKRKWLQFYTPDEKPERFEQIIQSWDTASSESELSNYSACTTWGLKKKKMYLLDVFRRQMVFPDLKRTIVQLARAHKARVVLIEEKSSGIQLIQQLKVDGFSIAKPAPTLDGNKVMRLNAQTPAIEGGFVLFPKEAPWLDDYLTELISFPNSMNSDQVDSTVYALAWATEKYVKGGWTAETLDAHNKTMEGILFSNRLFGRFM